MDACPYGNLMRQKGSEKLIAIAVLYIYIYIELKWIFVRFSLFAPHTNPHFRTDRTTHDVTSASTFCHLFRLPPPFQRHISLAERLHRLASQHSHVHVCVANTRVHMRPSSGRFSTCFVLSARSRVCVCSPPRGYIFPTFPSSLFTWYLLV